jgi:hypothetical protein
MRDSHLDYQQEAAPRHKEAQGCALHYDRAFRDASVALAPALVAEGFVNLLLSQVLHILYNGGYLIGLIYCTAQLKEGYCDVAKHTENHIHRFNKISDNYLLLARFK